MKTQGPGRGPVTVIITWKVEAGRESDFENVIEQIRAESSHHEGFEGVALIRPDQPPHHYHAMLTFADANTLHSWLYSRQRAELVDRLDGIAREADRRLTTTGLETWFSLPRRTVTPPPRWKMALVTAGAVYLLVPMVQYAAGPHVADWPAPLRAAVPAVMLTLLLTYVVLPTVSRWLRSWLYGDSDHRAVTEGAP